jgi:uncharacterized protein (DUF58 family)
MKPHVERDRFDPSVVQQVGRIDLIADLLATGFLQGMRRSRHHGFSTEFSEYKPYVPGDDLRFLDWRVYARSEKLFVKRFEAETSLDVLLLLDATASMAWRWEEEVTKLQYGANLLAAIACICTKHNDRPGLLVHDAARLSNLPPRCRREQLDAIFTVLESIEPGGGDALPALIEGLAGAKRHRCAIIICSDLEEDEEYTTLALEMMSYTDDRVHMIHLLHRAEEELPFGAVTHFEDIETKQRVRADIAALRKRHGLTVAEFRGKWRERCSKWGIGYQPVDTSMNYLDVLMGVAGLR